MKAIYYEKFQSEIHYGHLPDPSCPKDGVLIAVKATGLCRSDWHGWMGHDSDVHLPHVPGHELAGLVVETGGDVKMFKKGDRVTVPFSCGCGHCIQCHSGNQQICDNYFQPGFTSWGSFAELVMIRYADVNLVRLPDSMSFTEAALLGCRFITAYRGVISQGRIEPGDFMAVFGCGGVGLSAIMIGKAIGAQVIAIDISDDKIALAKSLGAEYGINALNEEDVPSFIKEITKGGVSVSVDALGNKETCVNGIKSLKKRGRHIQIGLMTGIHAEPPIPMPLVIANELEILGSHGMQAHQFPAMMRLINSGDIDLEKSLQRRISLEEAPEYLKRMDEFKDLGVTIIDQF